MSDRMEAADPGPAREAAFEQAIEALVASMPPDAARRLLVAAVPHWIEASLLAGLLGDTDAAEALDLLPRLRIVQPTSGGRHRYHDAARIGLRRILRRDDPQTWRAANRAAMAHFDALVADSGDLARDDARLEAIYHALVIDEVSGLAALRRAFEAAFWEHRLGLAEHLLSQARELEVEGILGGAASKWLDYFQARLEQAYRRGDLGLAAFEALASSDDPLLAAHAGWSQGRALAASQAWSQAIRVLRQTSEALGRVSASSRSESGESDEIQAIGARIQLALGESYRDLALRSGGFLGRDDTASRGRPALLWILRQLPFLIYQALLRSLTWLPNAWWWLPGSDYQDWIVTHLLERASSAYGRAAASGDPRVLAEARLALADIDHQLGRWARAGKRYGALLEDPLVLASPYRRARAELGLASARLDAGDAVTAASTLSELQTVFRRHGDAVALALCSQRLGRARLKLGQMEPARSAFAEGLGAFAAARDPLGLTEALREIEARSEAGNPQLASLLADRNAEARHYLARFPAGMLRRFRRLALYVALPPTLILTTILAMSLVPLVWIIEQESRFLASGQSAGTALVDYLILAGFAILPLLASLWIFRFIYGLVGLLAVRWLGRDPQRFEREQPDILVTDTAQMSLHRSGEAPRSAAWAETSLWQAVDHQLLGKRMPLLSRSTLVTEAAANIDVEGVTAGYAQLQRDVAARLSSQGKADACRSARFELLDPRWTLGILALALALSTLAYNTGKIPPIGFESEISSDDRVILSDLEVSDLDAEAAAAEAGESAGEGATSTTGAEASPTDAAAGSAVQLPLTGLVTLFIPMILLIFASVSHARLAWHDLALRQRTGLPGSPIARGFLILAALGWALLTVGWLALLASL